MRWSPNSCLSLSTGLLDRVSNKDLLSLCLQVCNSDSMEHLSSRNLAHRFAAKLWKYLIKWNKSLSWPCNPSVSASFCHSGIPWLREVASQVTPASLLHELEAFYASLILWRSLYFSNSPYDIKVKYQCCKLNYEERTRRLAYKFIINRVLIRVGGIWHVACLWVACLLGMPSMPKNVENRGGKEDTVITLRIRWFIGK